MAKTRTRVLLAIAATLGASLIGEAVYRCFRRDEESYRFAEAARIGEMYFRDADRTAIPVRPSRQEELAFRVRIQVAWPDQPLPAAIPQAPKVGESVEWFGDGYAMPRPSLEKNATWQPGARFFICYTGPRQDYFDADGCVEYRFNRYGIRDRDDLTLAKPSGWLRVVCLGDSFTLGWGVRAAHNWPALVESELHRQWPRVQVVNCGGCGSSYADEYHLALEHRFGRFEPDVVLVTLCLNDLILTNGKLCHYRADALRSPDGAGDTLFGSVLLADLRRRAAAAHALELDPQRDWVEELMSLPADHAWYRKKDETPAIYWKGGAPQAALRGIRDWCSAHGARPAVVVWPLLQGLGDGEFYPFAKLHDLVGKFCQDEHLPFLDLRPALRGHCTQELWVSPADMHPNERAQVLVAPALTAFVADALGLR